MSYHRSAPRSSSALGALVLALALPPASAMAQSATPLPPVAVETQDATDAALTTTQVPAADLATKAKTSDDTVRLLSDVPGVSIGGAGGISSLPVIHGLADDRIKTLLDGVPVTSACPNHMNPVLSYIAPTQVGEAEVLTGIAPVSQGGDSIAGTIRVEPKAPVFAKRGEGLHTEGELTTFYRSVNDALSSSAAATVAGENVSVGAYLSRAHALSYRDGNGDPVRGSEYENYSAKGTVSVRGTSDQLTIRGGVDYSPYEGFVNQPMDMTFNISTHVNGRYKGEFDWGTLEAELYWRQVRHEMNFLFGRPVSNGVGFGMPMLTHSQNEGYSLKAEIPLSNRDTLRIGNEFHRESLDDWWPNVNSTTSMGPGTFQNIYNGQRNRLGTYAEWDRNWTPQWRTLLGARNDTVLMNTGDVIGYNSGTDSSHGYYGLDAAAFNGLNHRHVDVNFDVSALVSYRASDTNTDEIGYARKSRSPNLYERYAWSTGMMASSMIGWFGDDTGYVGNNSLRPEVANTFSASAGWHDAAQKDWSVKATPYYTYVNDYIGVDRITSANGHSVSGTVLQFTNHDAQLFGFDLSGTKALARDTGYGDFDVKGTVGWVRGMQINNGENLYHLMPLNGRVTLDHRLGDWSNALEVQGVSPKEMVDTAHREPTTPGYALVNFRSAYRWEGLTLSAGVDNLFNKQYYEPLGGVDIKDWRYAGVSVSTPFPAVPGMGRSFNAGITVKF